MRPVFSGARGPTGACIGPPPAASGCARFESVNVGLRRLTSTEYAKGLSRRRFSPAIIVHKTAVRKPALLFLRSD